MTVGHDCRVRPTSSRAPIRLEYVRGVWTFRAPREGSCERVRDVSRKRGDQRRFAHSALCGMTTSPETRPPHPSGCPRIGDARHAVAAGPTTMIMSAPRSLSAVASEGWLWSRQRVPPPPSRDGWSDRPWLHRPPGMEPPPDSVLFTSPNYRRPCLPTRVGGERIGSASEGTFPTRERD
jgi:hypothetical protein